MLYDRFRTEEELLKSFISSLPAFNVYPKISIIAGSKIHPDIDVLEISGSGNQRQLIGYELKLMKYNKRNKGLSWDIFYKGLGQTFLYLKNGVHRAVLVLGFHKNIPDDKIIDDFRDWLWENKNLLNSILSPYISISFFLYRRGGLLPIIDAKSYFYAGDKKVRFLSQALLQGKFTFSKKFKDELGIEIQRS